MQYANSKPCDTVRRHCPQNMIDCCFCEHATFRSCRNCPRRGQINGSKDTCSRLLILQQSPPPAEDSRGSGGLRLQRLRIVLVGKGNDWSFCCTRCRRCWLDRRRPERARHPGHSSCGSRQASGRVAYAFPSTRTRPLFQLYRRDDPGRLRVRWGRERKCG